MTLSINHPLPHSSLMWFYTPPQCQKAFLPLLPGAETSRIHFLLNIFFTVIHFTTELPMLLKVIYEFSKLLLKSSSKVG